MKLPAWTNNMPSRVTICGKAYTVLYGDSSSFDCTTHIIHVGCKATQDVAREELIHEISEALHVELGSRFQNRDSEYSFAMDHTAFRNHNKLMVAALRDCGLMK